jgi:GrpB-like predicted nucleotidyltransferase (UPF0157 family)
MSDWESLGTCGRHIELLPYSPLWPRLFAREAQRILEACPAVIVAVEHIGSTAVPGLPAKPILDLMPGLAVHADGLRAIVPLQQLGYEYRGENGIPGRYYFDLCREQRVVVHAHTYEIGTWNWRRHLLFRDYLRAHPAVAAEYAALKQELALRYRNDRVAYTEAKGAFINEVVARAGQA